jgi:hypothetical protein
MEGDGSDGTEEQADSDGDGSEMDAEVVVPRQQDRGGSPASRHQAQLANGSSRSSRRENAKAHAEQLERAGGVNTSRV